MIKGSSKPLSEKLTKYVVEPIKGCWLWTGARDRDGYGRICESTAGYRRIGKSHRMSYLHHRGEIPDGKQVLHTCDMPPCINPDHLYLGDPAQNGRDKAKRGRAKGNPRWGEDNPMFGKLGALNPWYGKKHTLEARQKISEAKKKRDAK